MISDIQKVKKYENFIYLSKRKMLWNYYMTITFTYITLFLFICTSFILLIYLYVIYVYKLAT